MKLKDIMAYMDEASSPGDGENIDQLGMRCSRIRILAACAKGDSDKHKAQICAEMHIERLRGIVRRRIQHELRGRSE